mgnify:CR=1 FL=1
MRSRHCKDEPAFIDVTGAIWEGESKAMGFDQLEERVSAMEDEMNEIKRTASTALS